MKLAGKINKLPFSILRILRRASLAAERQKVKVFLVGGGVRDLLMGKRSFDIDLAVEGSGIGFCRALQQELGGEVIEHSDFDTATLKLADTKIDISACREETYAFAGALPKVFHASLREDLRRRDFTINAMAISLNRDSWGELIDLFGGLRDLKQKQINVLYLHSFIDDPTRILRCIRFKVRLGFKYSAPVRFLLRQAKEKKLLELVNAQRIRDELILMLKEDNPARQMKELHRLFGFGFIDRRIKVSARSILFVSQLRRTVLKFQNQRLIQRDIDSWVLYLAALFDSLKKKPLSEVLAKIRLRRGEEKRIMDCRRRSVVRQLKKRLTPFRLYKLLKPLSFEVLVFFYAKEKNRALRRNIIDFLAKYNNITLKVSGKDLLQMGIEPSFLYGKILEALLKKKLEGEIDSFAEELEYANAVYRRLRRYSGKNK